MLYKIAILGDFNPIHSTHHALNDSIRQVKKLFTDEIQFDWISTDIFNCKIAFDNLYSGLWIAPGSPYKDMQNVLDIIKYVRTNNIPTLGNCGGFQHIIIEFARNVCGITLADHEETNPGSPDLLIAKLSCSLVEQQEQLTICDKTSLLFNIIQQEQLTGKYFCSYGLNKSYINQLKSNGLKITALSSDGEVRAFEIANHPFFVGTLFQPALTSTADEPSPIITAFVRKSIEYKNIIASQKNTMIPISQFIQLFPAAIDQQDKEPWEITKTIIEIINDLIPSLSKDFNINDGVAVHKTAVIEQGVTLKPPVIIGEECFIGAHAYLRDGVYLADHVSIGPGCEIKSSIICSNSSAAHFNFIGDSIIGSNVNFEAGSVTANHYNDRVDKAIFVLHEGILMDIESAKFGSLIGDHSKIGANAVLSPGTLLPANSIVKRLALIEQVKMAD